MDTQRLYLKVCEQCGCQFESHFAVTRYCSARCANLSKKHKLRDERLQNLGDEVRERERLALLDKNFLTIADAARLLQMSRNTLYKIIKENDIPLKRFSLRTVRIPMEQLKADSHLTPQPSKGDFSVLISKAEVLLYPEAFASRLWGYCRSVGASGRASQGIGRLEDCPPLHTARLESSRSGSGTASASFRSPGTHLRPESVRVGLPRILHAGKRASSRAAAL